MYIQIQVFNRYIIDIRGEIYMNKFLNKVVVITGGTRGIGYETARAFLKEGATVVVLGSKKESVDKALQSLKEEFKEAKLGGYYPNLASLESVKADFKKIHDEFGAIDVLINNAGVSDDHHFGDYTEELANKIIDINIKGVLYSTLAAYPYMKEAHKGVVINTSSVVSKEGTTGGVMYPTSKFAVNGITISLARELAKDGIRVNAVAPGVTYTDMMKAVPDEYIKPLVASIPLARLGQPEDIANAFLFLASDEASYISGEILHVDGLVRC